MTVNSGGSPVRRAHLVRRWLTVGAAAITMALLGGCGVGSTSFTGGSIPTGGTRMFGRILSAENQSQPVGNASITITATPDDGAAPTTTTATASSTGDFAFTSVPLGSTTALVQVLVEPGASSGWQAQRFTFRDTHGSAANMLVALPPTGYDVTRAKSIQLSATPVSGHAGVYNVSAQIVDANGLSLGLAPTLLFAGNFGTLSPDGTLTAVAPGSGGISAFWYDVVPATTPVVVTPADLGFTGGSGGSGSGGSGGSGSGGGSGGGTSGGFGS